MAYIALSAIALSLLRSGIFLLLIGIFSFYLAFTGYRALYHKSLRDRRGTWLDWTGAIIALIGGACLIILARFGFEFFPERFRLVAQLFGAVGFLYAAMDLYGFAKPGGKPMRWWFLHMQRMIASYVAAITAFSAVNFQFLPTNIRWLWPSIVGTIGGIIWKRYYKRKFYRAKHHQIEPSSSPASVAAPAASVE
jgi:hypothetical protein